MYELKPVVSPVFDTAQNIEIVYFIFLTPYWIWLK